MKTLGTWLRLLLLLFPLFLQGAAWQAEVDNRFRAAIELEKEHATVLDSMAVSLRLQFPADYQVNINQLQSHLLRYGGFGLPPWSLESVDTFPLTPLNNGLLEQKIIFHLRPQLPGEYPLSFFGIVFDPKDPKKGKMVELFSKVFFVTIKQPDFHESGVVVPEPPLEPVGDFPVELAAEQRAKLLDRDYALERQNMAEMIAERSFPWMGLFFFALGLLFAVFAQQTVKEEKKNREDRSEKTRRIREKALHALNELKVERVGSSVEAISYVESLANTLRCFAEEQYNLKAPTLTTEEFLSSVKENKQLSVEAKAALADFLRKADAVKFGKKIPSLEDCQHVKSLAKQFIEN